MLTVGLSAFRHHAWHCNRMDPKVKNRIEFAEPTEFNGHSCLSSAGISSHFGLEKMSTTHEVQDRIETGDSPDERTGRVVSEGMEALLNVPMEVLDHGFVRVVDYLGNDSSIVQAARVSYGAGTKKAREDEGLIRYLMRHRHTTPFEMCEVKFHVKLPMFVARQWIRHRTANVNEYSARYSILDREFYIPDREHLAAQSPLNAQGRAEQLPDGEAERVLEILRTDSATAYDHYEQMLSQEGQRGLARELARMNLPSNIYTQWYWKTDLHNLFRFISLRADTHAQYEIRAYAEAIGRIVSQWVPTAWRAFEDYDLNGVHLSSAQLDCIRRMLRGEGVAVETSGLSPREWRELQSVISDDR